MRDRIFTLSFDIDKHLNPFIPASQVYRLPKPLSYFLGHHHKPNPKLPTLSHAFWAFIGAFCGIALIEAVYSAPLLKEQGAPLILASLGASAILTYNAIDSPLSQPRNLLVGHILSTTLGIGITKLFMLLPDSVFPSYRWLAGALSVGASSFIMTVTKTVHPPAGATALIAATTTEVTDIGWFLLPLIILGDALMLASGCVINNLSGREWPIYWWTPGDLRAMREERRLAKEGALAGNNEAKETQGEEGRKPNQEIDLEKGDNVQHASPPLRAHPPPSAASDVGSGATTVTYEREAEGRELALAVTREEDFASSDDTIRILPDRLELPPWMSLGIEELGVLEDLQQRLREGLREALTREETSRSHPISHSRSHGVRDLIWERSRSKSRSRRVS